MDPIADLILSFTKFPGVGNKSARRMVFYLLKRDSAEGKNIIASFHLEAIQCIVLCAYWDSRPFADHDADDANWNKPIDGANDGASGVGVLLETARLLKQHPINEKLGIDIVLFDLEDYGPPQSQAMDYYDENNYWALGSQYSFFFI